MTANDRPTTDLWIERLDLVGAVFAILSGVHRRLRIRVAASSPPARRLLAWWARRRCDAFAVAFSPPPIGVLDADGLSLFGRTEGRIIRLEASLAAYAEGYDWLAPEERRLGDLWMRALAADFLEDVRPSAYFICRIEATYRTRAENAPPPAEVVVWIAPRGFAEHVAVFFSADRPSEGTPPLRVRVAPGGRPLGACLPHLRRAAACLAAALGAARRPPEAVIPEAGRRNGCLLVQGDHYSLEAYPVRGVFGWQAAGGAPAAQVAVLLNRPDMPLSLALRDKLRKIGFGWVREDGPFNQLENPWRAVAGALRRSCRALPRRWSAAAVWRWSRAFELDLRAQGYQALLTRNNVVGVMLGYDTFNSGQMLFAVAARKAGAAMFLIHWSVYSCLYEFLNRAASDAAFAWGPHHAAFLRRTACGPILQVGVYGADGATDDDAEKAAALRRRFSDNVRFRVTLFDSAFGPRGLMWREAVEAFYRDLLAAIAARPDWGCVIKSKYGVLGMMSANREIHDAIDALIAEGRCVAADDDERTVVAALAGDAVVACGVATAGFMGAMAGRPTIHVDSGRFRHPIKLSPGAENIIAADGAAAAAMLERIAAGDPSIGDHRHCIGLLDPYGDWRGAARMGEALADYLQARSQGADAAGAVAEMRRRFAARWGDYRAGLADAPDMVAARALFDQVAADQGLADWPSFPPPCPAD